MPLPDGNHERETYSNFVVDFFQTLLCWTSALVTLYCVNHLFDFLMLNAVTCVDHERGDHLSSAEEDITTCSPSRTTLHTDASMSTLKDQNNSNGSKKHRVAPHKPRELQEVDKACGEQTNEDGETEDNVEAENSKVMLWLDRHFTEENCRPETSSLRERPKTAFPIMDRRQSRRYVEPELTAHVGEVRSHVEEVKSCVDHVRSHAETVQPHVHEERLHVEERRSHADKVRTQADRVRSPAHDVRTHTDAVRTHTDEVRSHVDERRSCVDRKDHKTGRERPMSAVLPRRTGLDELHEDRGAFTSGNVSQARSHATYSTTAIADEETLPACSCTDSRHAQIKTHFDFQQYQPLRKDLPTPSSPILHSRIQSSKWKFCQNFSEPPTLRGLPHPELRQDVTPSRLTGFSTSKFSSTGFAKISTTNTESRTAGSRKIPRIIVDLPEKLIETIEQCNLSRSKLGSGKPPSPPFLLPSDTDLKVRTQEEKESASSLDERSLNSSTDSFTVLPDSSAQ